LWNHFVEHTAATLPLVSDFSTLWQNEIPKLAERNLFLQHGLLALAALHMRFLYPHNFQHYHSQACEHHLKATASFRTTVSHVDEENCDAILVFSIAVNIFQFTTLLCHNLHRIPDFSDALEAFSTLRNALNMSWDMRQFLSRSPFARRLQRIGASVTLQNAETELRNLDALDYLNNCLDAAEDARRTCGIAIRALNDWYPVLGSSPQTWVNFAWWPSAIPEEFLTLLKQKHQVALMIFVHWCTGFSKAPKRWYSDGWAGGAALCAIDLLNMEQKNLFYLNFKDRESLTPLSQWHTSDLREIEQ